MAKISQRAMVSGVAATLCITGAATAQRAQLPPECRKQIMELCQTGGGMRECVRASLPKLSETCRSAISERAGAAQPLPKGMTEIAYGQDAKQRLDLIAPPGNARPPLILFIHGGGWAIGDKRMSIGAKADHFVASGYAFASVNYRLVPQATVEQQAADVAAALAKLRGLAAGSNYDRGRIILMGHSAGAHLAALVASDPAYLKAAGVPMDAIKGVVLLDGAGYDVAKQVASPRNKVAGMYGAAFGTDPARHARLSPTLHAAAPNAQNWLILPVATRADSSAQSRALAAALNAAGAKATVTPIPNTDHGGLNRNLGTKGDFATAQVDAFLKAVVARASAEASDRSGLQVNLLETSYPALAGCGGVNAREWSARRDGSELVVEGEVGTKPSTMLRLDLDPRIRESFPVQRTIMLTATMPTEPTIDMLVAKRVTGRWPIDGALGVVSVRCGAKVIATIRDPLER